MNDFSYLEEVVVDGGVLVVESGSSVGGAGTFVGLDDHQELLDEALTLRYEQFLVEMDIEVLVVSNNFKIDDLTLLVLVNPHSEDESTLRVSLTPLLGLWVVQSKTEETLSELVHDIYPQQEINLMILESEQGIDILEGAQVEAAGIGSALFVTGGDGAESGVPGVALGVAGLEFLTSDWVGVFSHVVVQSSDTVTEELVASDVNLVGPKSVLGELFGLLWSGKLDCGDAVAWHGVAEIYVLESNGFSDVIIVRNVDTEWAAVGGESNDLKGGEIRSQELLFLHVIRPWKLWDNLLRVSDERLELLGLFLVDNCYPTFPVGSCIFWVNI